MEIRPNNKYDASSTQQIQSKLYAMIKREVLCFLSSYVYPQLEKRNPDISGVIIHLGTVCWRCYPRDLSNAELSNARWQVNKGCRARVAS